MVGYVGSKQAINCTGMTASRLLYYHIWISHLIGVEWEFGSSDYMGYLNRHRHLGVWELHKGRQGTKAGHKYITSIRIYNPVYEHSPRGPNRSEQTRTTRCENVGYQMS
jgi:hypothetical protein